MIFSELSLENFRQFRGLQVVKFSTDRTRNVTVLHGFNGAGKTTLLNAFVWVLFGDTTPDFEDPTHLENEAAFATLEPGSSMRVSVKLKFTDGDREYWVERSRDVQRTENGERRSQPDQLSLKYIDETGEVRDSNNPQTHIEQLLPKRLYPFFFFNGERIDRLAGPDAYDQIEDGVKVLLDLELFDRAISHMETGAAKRLREEIANHAGEEGKRAREERDKLEEAERALGAMVEQVGKTVAALVKEKDAIDARLATMPELARLQAERKAEEARHTRVKNDLGDARRELGRVVSEHAYLILGGEALGRADAVLVTAHKKGEIPTPLKRQFVDELLERGVCICGRRLPHGDAAHDAVVAWRDRAASEELEAAATVTKAALGGLTIRRDRGCEDIDRLQSKRTNLLRERREVEERLDELSERIGTRDFGEDPVKLEARRRQIEDDLRRAQVEQRELENKAAELKRAIEEKDREIRNLERVDALGKMAQRRLQAVQNVTTALINIRQLRYEELRRDLAQRLEEVWSGISIKDYRAELDNGFHLRLTKDIGGSRETVRGASTGEKQVLALAFIGSLLEKARSTGEGERDEVRRMFRGGRYGLVIDSAFGQLEPEYRRDVAQWVRTLAPQVVVLVSESQWRREVEEALQAHVGKAWVLRCATPKQRPKDVTLRGRSYQYVVESTDRFESTSLEEVEL